MSIKLSALAHMIQSLSAGELAEFRCWFARFDADTGNRQPSAGVPSGHAVLPALPADGTHAAGISTKR